MLCVVPFFTSCGGDEKENPEPSPVVVEVKNLVINTNFSVSVTGNVVSVNSNLTYTPMWVITKVLNIF